MAEPISLDEAKRELRVDGNSDDTSIADNIVAAREWVEDYTGLVLTRREVTESIRGFDDPIRLRAWPVDLGEAVEIAYRDSSGIDQAVVGASARSIARPAVIYPAAGSRWPANAAVSGQIDVTFTAGFADSADIPKVLKRAMFVMLTAFFEDREGGELFTAAEASAKSLCRRHKRWTL